MTDWIAFGIVNSNSGIPLNRSITEANIGVGIEKNGESNDEVVFVDMADLTVGWGDIIENNSTLSIQIDLRSEEKEKRTIHFIINNKQQECFFYNVPESVKLSIRGKDDSIEILSISQIRERITKPLKYEQGYDWTKKIRKDNSGGCCIC